MAPTTRTTTKSRSGKGNTKMIPKEGWNAAVQALRSRDDIVAVCNFGNGVGVWAKKSKSSALMEYYRIRQCDFQDLFNSQVVSWCMQRPHIELNAFKAAQFGLSDDGPEGQDYDVRRLVMATGDTIKHEGQVSGGEKGMVYGSTEGQDGSMRINDGKSWFAVNLWTFKVKSSPGSGAEPLDDQEEDEDKELSYTIADGFVDVTEEENGTTSLDRTFEWLSENKGLVLLLEGARGRDMSTEAEVYLDRNFKVPLQCQDDLCMPVALLNASAVIRGLLDGAETLQSVTPAAVLELKKKSTLCGLEHWVETNMPDLRLEHIQDENGDNRRTKWLDVPRVLEEFPLGVYILRLTGRAHDGGRVDHMTVVDTDTERIWDSFEAHPMVLSPAALACCVGDGAQLVAVRDARKVVQLGFYPDGKNRHGKLLSRRQTRAHYSAFTMASSDEKPLFEESDQDLSEYTGNENVA